MARKCATSTGQPIVARKGGGFASAPGGPIIVNAPTWGAAGATGLSGTAGAATFVIARPAGLTAGQLILTVVMLTGVSSVGQVLPTATGQTLLSGPNDHAGGPVNVRSWLLGRIATADANDDFSLAWGATRFGGWQNVRIVGPNVTVAVEVINLASAAAAADLVTSTQTSLTANALDAYIAVQGGNNAFAVHSQQATETVRLASQSGDYMGTIVLTDPHPILGSTLGPYTLVRTSLNAGAVYGVTVRGTP